MFSSQLSSRLKVSHPAEVRGYEVRGVFLCISKPLDKVQHDGIIHKLKRNEISGNLLSFLTDLLRNKKRYSYS